MAKRYTHLKVRLEFYYVRAMQLKELGMYNRHTNQNGVVRDHRLSVFDAFRQRLDPEIVRHPANCQFLTHKDNARKTIKSSISREELLNDIEEWNKLT